MEQANNCAGSLSPAHASTESRPRRHNAGTLPNRYNDSIMCGSNDLRSTLPTSGCVSLGRGRGRSYVPGVTLVPQVSNSSGEQNTRQENLIPPVGMGRGRRRTAPYPPRRSINEPENQQINSITTGDDSNFLPPIGQVEQSRDLLDIADKRLHTACQNQNVQFRWPNCSSGRSCDEDEQNQLNRRQMLRNLLQRARTASQRRNNNAQRNVEVTISQPSENEQQSNISIPPQPPMENTLPQQIRNRSRFLGRAAKSVLSCNQIVEEHSCGSRFTPDRIPRKQCPFCSALLWPNELSSICCSNGKIKLPLYPQPPDFLQELWGSVSAEAVIFRKHCRVLNNALAIASQKINEVRPPGGGWAPSVVIQGKVHYFVGPLHATPGQIPRFGQIWVHDPDADVEANIRLGNMRLPASMSRNTRNILASVLRRLQDLLRPLNPYIRDFITASEIPENQLSHCSLVINASVRPQQGHSRVYNQGFSEISVLLNEEPGRRDIILQKRGGGIREVSDTHRSSDALHFVLIHPLGHDGWHLQLNQVDPTIRDQSGNPTPTNHRLTTKEFYSFHLHSRPVSGDWLLRMGRLLQEYVCVQFAKCENQRLYWMRNNQSTIRAELYNNVIDSLNRSDSSRNHIGRNIILSPQFTGSKRDFHRRFQDAMAIVRSKHKPDLFVTVTCNVKWKEITEALLEGQKPEDRPDIIARIFKLKLKAIVEDLVKNNIFGKCVAHLYVVEFQKRGLPHAHILLIFSEDSRVRTVEDVDNIVCAELPPDPSLFPEGTEMKLQAIRLQEIVVSQMRHGPCGRLNPGSPCMRNKDGILTDKCQKFYPKPFVQQTEWDDRDTYPKYRRRSPADGGRTIGQIDNGWIVPYSPYLSLKYNCHINVEVCISALASKYLFKYVTKGVDRTMVRIDGQDFRDEISEYQDRRSIGAAEAMWRLLGYHISERYPAVYALRVHLPNQQMVYFQEGEEERAIEREASRKTELTEFFTFNRNNPATRVSYINFPKYHVWNRRIHQWKLRQREFDTIGRILTVHPVAGEVFYLRMLLSHGHSAGAKSFEDLKIVNGNRNPTFQATCFCLGLLQDDREWEIVLEEASHLQMCPQLRELFVTILQFCTVANPANVFERFHHQWCDDYAFRARNPVDPVLLRTLVLCDIERRLQSQGKSLAFYNLPEVDANLRTQAYQAIDQNDSNSRSLPMEIQEELDFDREELATYLNTRLHGPASLTPSQRIPYDAVLGAVESGRPGAFFIDAPGGTGKSYVLNSILAAVRLLTPDSIAIAVAASGIAATLLLQGRTFHSRFKAPLDVTETSTLGISEQSNLAELIRRAKLIVWDEAPMNNRFHLEALDRCLRMICQSNLVFGGKPILLAGDFRQVLPVVKRGSRAQTVNAVINRSQLWQHFQCFSLHENIRVLRNGCDGQLLGFSDWLLKIGEGKIDNLNGDCDYILLPSDRCLIVNAENPDTIKQGMMRLISFVYPNILYNMSDRNWLAERAILSPLNNAVDEINELCLNEIPGNLIVCNSADTTIQLDDATRFPTEYLNSISVNGIPPHRLLLKIGAPIMLLRNINPKEGLCNGTRLILMAKHGEMLQCQIAGGERDGRVVFLPRITFTPNSTEEFPMEWKRRQFPVRTSFAMTINKSQGQSLARVGVWLEESVFSHGQLYVACSRVGNPSNIKYAIKKHNDYPENATRNVVYKEVFHTEVGTLLQSNRLQQLIRSPCLPRPAISSFWCGFNMNTFPPNNIVGATLSWLYMPVIFAALGITCPAWTFPETDLPQQWDNWVSTYSMAFETDQPAIDEFLEDNFDTASRDHLTADAQDHLIHDRYSHVPAVALVAQEMQEWAIEQQQRHG